MIVVCLSSLNLHSYFRNLIYDYHACNHHKYVSDIIQISKTLSFLGSPTQSFQQPSFSPSSVGSNMWTQYSYSYLATTSAHVTLKFSFRANADFSWQLDDVSVRDQASTEMLSNGDFESSTSLSRWTRTSSCPFLGTGPYCGLSTSACHSSNKCYFHSYIFSAESVYQSFNVTSGQVYDVSFWLYLKYSNSNFPNLANVEMDVTIS